MDDWLCVKCNVMNLLENIDFLVDNHLMNLRVSQMDLVSIARLMPKGGVHQKSKTSR